MPANAFAQPYSAYPQRWKPSFPFALYFSEEADRLIPVYLPGNGEDARNHDMESDGNGQDWEIYSAERHDGHLFCPGCRKAKLHVNHGKEGRAGNPLDVQKQHLKTNADSRHDDECAYKPAPRETDDYDDALGYRVHLNLKNYIGADSLRAIFNNSASIYYKGPNGKPELKSAFSGMRKMRSFEIHTPANFLTLLRRGEFSRLKDSVFINTDLILKEKEFLIRHTRKPGEPEKRFIGLFERLARRGEGRLLPCLMEFRVDKNMDGVSSATARPIFHHEEKATQGYTGVKHFLVPRIRSEKGLTLEPGTYLVLGYAGLSPAVTRKDAVIHHMDIEIFDPRSQILQVDLVLELHKTIKKHAACPKAAIAPGIA